MVAGQWAAVDSIYITIIDRTVPPHPVNWQTGRPASGAGHSAGGRFPTGEAPTGVSGRRMDGK